MATHVVVLGTGIMGAPMARNLLAAGHEVTVWNRSREKAEPLASHGASLAGSPGEACVHAEVVLTMLSNGDVVEDVMAGQGALAAMGQGALWVQTSTVGVAATERLAGLAAKSGVEFVDAPVLGTKQPAESGELVILASGSTSLRDRCQPLFDAVGKRTLWVGEVGAGSRLKLVVNMWLLGLVGALAESVALAGALGVDVGAFLEAIDGGPVGTPYANIKGRAMASGDFDPSFPLRLAGKDLGLVREAAATAGAPSPLADVLADQIASAIQAGHSDDDMAALYAAWKV
ncbi:MAG: NAD(P)-dependent oxidoreductase [Egibacteraceae bacterium]